jgi:hypothetical protein
MIEALSLTLLLEAAVLTWAKVWSRRLLWLFVAVNVLTNASLNAIVLSHPDLGWAWILFFELLVVIVEAFAYRLAPMNVRRAFFLSFLANLFSATVGTWILFLLP